MSIKSISVLLIYFLFFVPPSYWVLSKTGVKEKLKSRAFQFGFVIATLQIALPLACIFISLTYGYTVGAIVGLVTSYLYVDKVLHLRWYKNVAVVFFLPIVAGILSAPLMYIWYFANA